MDDLEKQLAHLDRYGVVDKDSTLPPTPRRKKPLAQGKKPYEVQVDWEIDLHGFGIIEAEAYLQEIFDMAKRAGMQKIRVIHGGRMGHYGPMARHIQRLLRSQLRHLIQRIELDGLNDGSLLIYLNK